MKLYRHRLLSNLIRSTFLMLAVAGNEELLYFIYVSRDIFFSGQHIKALRIKVYP